MITNNNYDNSNNFELNNFELNNFELVEKLYNSDYSNIDETLINKWNKLSQKHKDKVYNANKIVNKSSNKLNIAQLENLWLDNLSTNKTPKYFEFISIPEQYTEEFETIFIDA